MSRAIDLIGQQFGRLIVIDRVPDPDGRGKAWWRCQCACGAERNALGAYLRDGRTNSCGTHCINAAGRRPWPVDPRFLVGPDGSIAGPRGRLLTPHLSNGYLTVTIFRNGRWWKRPVHIIVCEAFHGPRPDGMEVAHGNGDQLDCRAVNLRWSTHIENESDKLDHGRRLQGERHHQHKLTEDEVRAIRGSAESSYTLGPRCGVAPATVRAIRRRKTWRHVA